MLGLTSAVAATLLFCLMAGVKAVLDMYAYGSFSTVMELFDFLLRRSITTAHEVAASPALPAAAAAALVIGVLAERTRRAVDETDLPKA
jgi:hypothetical protein